MKPVLLLAAAALAAAPALAQDAPPAPTPAPVPDSGTPGGNFLSFQNDPFRVDPFSRPGHGQCFNGRTIVGANRSGERTLYVQSRKSPVYRLDLAESCDALYAAQKLSVRASGYAVCAGDKAIVVVKTPAGDQRCRVSEVKRITKTEIADIAAATRR